MFTQSAQAIQALFSETLAPAYRVLIIHSNKHQQVVDIFGGDARSCTVTAVQNAFSTLGYTLKVNGRMLDTRSMDIEAESAHFDPETRELSFIGFETLEAALRCVRKYYVENGYETDGDDDDYF